MASLAACNWPKPVSLIPCLSWTTASCVFTDGVMSRAIPWHLLRSQYLSNSMYKYQVWPKIKSPESELMRQVAVYCNNNSELMNELTQDTPKRKTSLHKLKSPTNQKTEREVYTFMRILLDEFTHLGNFPKPVDTDLVIVVTAMKDAYVPLKGYTGLDELWPGIETRYLKSGHISSFLFKQDAFKEAIHDGLLKQIRKYHPDSAEARQGLRGINVAAKQKWLPKRFVNARLSGNL